VVVKTFTLKKKMFISKNPAKNRFHKEILSSTTVFFIDKNKRQIIILE